MEVATAVPAKHLDLRGGKRPPRKARVHELDTLDPRGLERAKKALRSRRHARGLQAPSILAATGTDVLKIQPGLAATDNIPANDGTPPDTTGAIGPDQYLEFVNSKVAVYDRNLTEDSTKDLDKFAGVDVAQGHDVFDPQIQWDPVAGHWFYVAVDVFDISAPDEQDFLAFGWSKTDDPTDLDNGWCRFFVSSDTGGASKGTFSDDYPHLGHDDKHVIFGTNVFKLSNEAFRTARIWAFNKPGNYSDCNQSVKLKFKGSPQSGALKLKDGHTLFSPIPANLSDSSNKGYLLAADYPPDFGSAKEIGVWSVSGSSKINIQSRGNIVVDPYSFPDNVPQPSGGDDLDALDARLTQAVGHADPDAGGDEAVWTQHTVNGSPAQVRWYELRPGLCTGTTKCPGGALRQQGTVSDDPLYVFNAAISPTKNGNQAVIHYNVGDSSTEAEVRSRSRLSPLSPSGTPLGDMGSEITLASNDNIDQDFSCPVCRWGDYAGASPDPQNDDVVWGSNQLNGNPHNDDPRWITQNFALQPTP